MPMPTMPMPQLPPKPMPPTGNTSPVAMSTQNFGQRARAMAQIAGICKQLETMIPMLGVGSDEGKDVLGVLKTLSKYAAGVSPEITAQEQKLMAAKTPAVPSSPMQIAQQRMASMGPGSAGPAASAAA